MRLCRHCEFFLEADPIRAVAGQPGVVSEVICRLGHELLSGRSRLDPCGPTLRKSQKPRSPA